MTRKIAFLISLASSCYSQPESPLAVAARAGDVVAIRTLVKSGADPNEPGGGNDWTPLEHAIHKHQNASVSALLDARADPNRADPRGLTPLMMAAGYGYTDTVQLLLARGADPRVRDRDGLTALDLAATGVSDIDRFTLFDCQSSTVKLLREAGAPSGSGTVIAKLKRC
jgi:ankyrin repeat protein